ncbi:conjugal transfer protein [Streptomyces sp. NBC_01136]|uniref:conjugal transfer protein n=1 Tax=Streptomyces sp. NBC_01136 TaxID=2903754 RepID=UPI00386B1FD3|nr:conjugal transfer protein [Streptomyces sp. NBC_01136]
METRRPLTKAQKAVLATAFVPMLATGVAGGIGTFSNISRAYGTGTALGAVAAGEGATAVLALVLLGLTMLGQSSPRVIRIGLWALPAAASAMAAMAASDPGRTVIYAVTPMGMCVSAEGMAFLARRIVVHTDGRDAEAEARAAAVVRELAYHRAVAANHPDEKVRGASERTSWKLARKVGLGDHSLGIRLLDIQRERITIGADAALASMFGAPAATIANQDETRQATVNQSPSELRESTPIAPAPVGEPDADELADPVPAATSIESAPVKALPAAGPRRSTGRVPVAARSPRPTRTADKLLTEAREKTAGWSDAELTAEAIRKAVRTAPVKARALRDTLKAERNSGTDQGTGTAKAA